MPRKVEKPSYLGMKFGRLLVTNDQNGVCDCRCECGALTSVIKGNLTKGNTKSCGCLRREMGGRDPIHGKWNHPAYPVLRAMVSRCHGKADSFRFYGARGISVCDEWRGSPKAFCDWADANGYAKGMQIDRIDADGDYSPQNCRWVTAKQNSNNRRSNRIVSLRGEQMTVSQAADAIGVSYSRFYKRLSRGMSPDAIAEHFGGESYAS